MVSLFEDPKQIIRADKVTEFWPIKKHTAEERVNATARFIIYATCILYIIRRDIRVFILGSTCLGVLYVMETSNMIKGAPPTKHQGLDNDIYSACQRPTKNNPMANVLVSDYDGRPDRPSACDYHSVRDEVNYMLSGNIAYGPQKSRSPMPEYQRNAYSRQFVSGPVTTIPGAQTEFAEWLYGKKHEDTCKTNPMLCDPNARGVQLEAFGGLQPNNDKRSGMIGGGNGSA